MKGLAIGQRASLTRTFTPQDMDEYRALTGDTNFAPDTIPGPLLGGLVSCLLGTQLPGRGTNWLKQSYRWFAPAAIGTAITATVEITRLRPDKNLVNLHGTFKSASGVVIGEGETLVGVSDLHPV
jgi:3-hydroxybutyryl-CoA dehydratase